ncbi:MAG: GFA family protein [Deltaproteobacteria bacterium]|nr:GFA family protein [Deltaproteobacteria bacterium]
MKTYLGGCHCGAVRFEVKTDLDKAVLCNCSICRKKGVLNHRVVPTDFKLRQGWDKLVAYRFGTRTASHFFCPACGIHTHANPRANPRMVSVNLNCLDDPIDPKEINIEFFDGLHWEEAMAEKRKKDEPKGG